ncbi:cupredoxin domain-containing protein [Candidatus Micrarchaeota archaeon]|nr:cupredoxin domain-containing protein [Candidatus Micrarchaeota archaeon]
MNKVILGLSVVLMVGVAIGFISLVMATTPTAAPVVGGQGQAVVQPPGNNPGSGVQDVYVRAQPSGRYDYEQITVKKGIPVRFHFTAERGSGCGAQLIMESFGVRLISRGEEQVATFTPTQTGQFAYHCGMNMFRGSMTVV